MSTLNAIGAALQSKWAHALIVGIAAGAPAFYSALGGSEPMLVAAALGLAAAATLGHAVASSQPK